MISSDAHPGFQTAASLRFMCVCEFVDIYTTCQHRCIEKDVWIAINLIQFTTHFAKSSFQSISVPIFNEQLGWRYHFCCKNRSCLYYLTGNRRFLKWKERKSQVIYRYHTFQKVEPLFFYEKSNTSWITSLLALIPPWFSAEKFGPTRMHGEIPFYPSLHQVTAE